MNIENKKFGSHRKGNLSDYDISEFFNYSSDLLCIAGADGYFKILSPAWESLLGYSQQELKSRPFIEFVYPQDVEMTIAEAERLVSEEGSCEGFKNRYVHRDGSLRWLSWKSTSRGDYFWCAVRDVTEQVKSETYQVDLKGNRFVIECADLRLVVEQQKCFHVREDFEREIELTSTEYRLLFKFISSPEVVFSRADLLSYAWGSDVHITDRTVDSHVSHLRKKLSDTLCEISSIRGQGYRINIGSL